MSINFRSRHEIESLPKINDGGGEGAIYEYGSDNAIKLFFKSKKAILPRKEKKILYFISIKDRIRKTVPNFIAPIDDVRVNNEFVAYVMKKLVGVENLHQIVKPKYLASMNYTNKDVLEIITKFGVDLEKLHNELGILIGDISDYNFQIIGKNVYFIDAESSGVIGKFSPDAYTDNFTCPESYQPDGKVKFSLEYEYYNFAVLAFFVLTRVHPFGGTYMEGEEVSSLSIKERMLKGISVLGQYKDCITIPKISLGWKWLSPKLKEDFHKIFDCGEKFDITPDLKELLSNMKYCPHHKLYYYGGYNECPLCNEGATVKTAPVIIKAVSNAKGPKLTFLFSGENYDCAYVLSGNHFLNNRRQVIHIKTGRTWSIRTGEKVDFSEDGKIVYVTDNSNIKIYDANDCIISTIEILGKENYIVRDKKLYFIDKGNNLIEATINAHGILPKYLDKVYRPLFEVSEDGKVFIVSLYPKKAIVRTETYNFEVDYDGWINEYAIKYDKATHKWLFVYQLSNGKYRTMLFGKNEIEYDDDVISYNAMPLSNIDFFKNVVYTPENGKIVGINLVKNTAKEFLCSVVDESSKLEFTGRGFKIYNPNAIYDFS